MNKQRRKQVRETLGELRNCVDALETIKDEEEDALSNYPENLQTSDRYTESEEAVDALTEAVDSINEVIDSLENII